MAWVHLKRHESVLRFWQRWKFISQRFTGGRYLNARQQRCPIHQHGAMGFKWGNWFMLDWTMAVVETKNGTVLRKVLQCYIASLQTLVLANSKHLHRQLTRCICAHTRFYCISSSTVFDHKQMHFTTRRVWLICIKCTFRVFCWKCKSSTNFLDWGPWAWSEWKKV